MSNQPHQSSLNSRRTRPLSPRSRRLSRLLLLSALALLVGVLSACGSSDSGEDVEREAAAGTEKCDAPPARGADWPGCDKSGTNLRDADLTDANLSGANLTDATCGNHTWWPDGTRGHGRHRPGCLPPTNRRN